MDWKSVGLIFLAGWQTACAVLDIQNGRTWPGVLSPWCLAGAALAWFGFDWEWIARWLRPAWHARWRLVLPHALACDNLRRLLFGTATPRPREWAMAYEVALMLLPGVVL